MKIVPLSAHTFVHITYLQTESFGKVACNGLVFISKREAAIFDTPTNDSVSQELMHWVEKSMKARIKAVVINHFHNDCLGGLKAFQDRNIPSYAHTKTIELAKNAGYLPPQYGFEDKQELTIGKEKVINQFFGEAHTQDNIVSFIPSEKVLFGGCMVKAVGANFGFLGDANVKTWSTTVQKVKANSKEIQFIVPGHGKTGGIELLDYTIKLFKNGAQPKD